MDRALEADPAVINFVGLEPQLPDKVYIPRVSTLSGDQTKRGRIKILIRNNEIGMVQDVDERGFDLKPDSFRDRDPLRQTKVKVKVIRTTKAIQREIAECTRSGRRHQAGL